MYAIRSYYDFSGTSPAVNYIMEVHQSASVSDLSGIGKGDDNDAFFVASLHRLGIRIGREGKASTHTRRARRELVATPVIALFHLVGFTIFHHQGASLQIGLNGVWRDSLKMDTKVISYNFV